jgi:glycosyltransferase involved in cell wall biosynthesis
LPGGGAERAVSVIVTACDDSKALRALLERLRVEVDPLRGEIVLVVNGPEQALDLEARLALEKSCDQLIFEPRIGKSHALNTAIAWSHGAVVAFTDDDASPRPGWLAALVEPLLSPDRPSRRVGCGGPVVPIFPEDTPSWYRELVLGRSSHFLGPRHDLGREARDYDSQTGSEAPLGANCAYLREVFDAYRYDPRLGPNRETGLRGGEDFVLARMLLRDGYSIRYVPEASIEHEVHPDRMTRAYVQRGHYLQGVESVRIARALAPQPGPGEQGGRLRLRSASSRWSPIKLIIQLSKLRLRLVGRWVASGFALPEVERLTLQARIALCRGRLRETLVPGGRV